MNTKGRNKGPSLPKFILEHIDRGDPSGMYDSKAVPYATYLRAGLKGNPHRTKHPSRKDARKQQRLDRKKRRADHVSASKRKIEEYVDVPDPKRRKTVHQTDKVRPSNPPHSKESPKARARGPPAISDARRSKPTALERLASRSTRKVPEAAFRTPRTREETEEDAYIAYLEARLGYANESKRRKGDEADGLDGMYMCLECRRGTC